MRLTRTPLLIPFVAAVVTGLTLAAVPADAGSKSYSASYAVKAGARVGTSETAREIADIRKVALASSAKGEFRVVVRADEVPAQSSRIDGVYSVEVGFANGDIQTISYSTDTVAVNGSLVVNSGLLDLSAEAGVTLRRGRVGIEGEGCSKWTATANHRSDTVVFKANACGGLRFVDEIAVEAVAVTTADKRVAYDASGELRQNVHIR